MVRKMFIIAHLVPNTTPVYLTREGLSGYLAFTYYHTRYFYTQASGNAIKWINEVEAENFIMGVLNDKKELLAYPFTVMPIFQYEG